MQLHLYRGSQRNVKVDAVASFALMYPMTTLSAQTTRAWISLLSVSQTLLQGIEIELKERGLPKLSWYDALLEIEKAGAEGIRPYELKERLLLPQYGTSRLLDRLTKAGLITREDVAGDGRGQIIRLTSKGLETRRAIWPIYAEMLVKSVQQSLSEPELNELVRLLGKLAHTKK
jgi:DNA-binding MarR family transcriptional regulator